MGLEVTGPAWWSGRHVVHVCPWIFGSAAAGLTSWAFLGPTSDAMEGWGFTCGGAARAIFSFDALTKGVGGYWFCLNKEAVLVHFSCKNDNYILSALLDLAIRRIMNCFAKDLHGLRMRPLDSRRLHLVMHILIISTCTLKRVWHKVLLPIDTMVHVDVSIFMV
jgi:hypothetical protein